MKWTSDQVTGITLIVGCLCLLALGIDSEVKFIIGVAAGWIFGSQYMERRLKIGGK